MIIVGSQWSVGARPFRGALYKRGASEIQASHTGVSCKFAMRIKPARHIRFAGLQHWCWALELERVKVLAAALEPARLLALLSHPE